MGCSVQKVFDRPLSPAKLLDEYGKACCSNVEMKKGILDVDVVVIERDLHPSLFYS
jgi:hypothetical protein